MRRHGGEIDNIIGDALMVVFNARGDQPDHPRRAASAALELLDTMEAVPDSTRLAASARRRRAWRHERWCRGAAGTPRSAMPSTWRPDWRGRLRRTVVIGGATAARLPGAVTEPLGRIEVKGREEPVEVRRLISL